MFLDQLPKSPTKAPTASSSSAGKAFSSSSSSPGGKSNSGSKDNKKRGRENSVSAIKEKTAASAATKKSRYVPTGRPRGRPPKKPKAPPAVNKSREMSMEEEEDKKGKDPEMKGKEATAVTPRDPDEEGYVRISHSEPKEAFMSEDGEIVWSRFNFDRRWWKAWFPLVQIGDQLWKIGRLERVDLVVPDFTEQLAKEIGQKGIQFFILALQHFWFEEVKSEERVAAFVAANFGHHRKRAKASKGGNRKWKAAWDYHAMNRGIDLDDSSSASDRDLPRIEREAVVHIPADRSGRTAAAGSEEAAADGSEREPAPVDLEEEEGAGAAPQPKGKKVRTGVEVRAESWELGAES